VEIARCEGEVDKRLHEEVFPPAFPLLPPARPK
jgi:hypothetical protein